jgi:hypothetical protein
LLCILLPLQAFCCLSLPPTPLGSLALPLFLQSSFERANPLLKEVHITFSMPKLGLCLAVLCLERFQGQLKLVWRRDLLTHEDKASAGSLPDLVKDDRGFLFEAIIFL